MSLHRSSLWTGSKRRRQIGLLAGDSLILFATVVLAVLLRRIFVDGGSLAAARQLPLPSGVYALVFTYLAALYIFDQYNLKRDIRSRAGAVVLLLAGVVGLSLTTTLAFFFRGLQLGR
ncbi:MAG: hypothetical protein KIS63_19680, partial [Caldilineales bacterium]|nr:hypothetical protein [Caldilineales bacterium]